MSYNETKVEWGTNLLNINITMAKEQTDNKLILTDKEKDMLRRATTNYVAVLNGMKNKLTAEGQEEAADKLKNNITALMKLEDQLL